MRKIPQRENGRILKLIMTKGWWLSRAWVLWAQRVGKGPRSPSFPSKMLEHSRQKGGPGFQKLWTQGLFSFYQVRQSAEKCKCSGPTSSVLVSRLSKQFLDCLDSLWIVRTVSYPSEWFPCQPYSFEQIYALSQKLSGFAMLPRYNGFSDSDTVVCYSFTHWHGSW